MNEGKGKMKIYWNEMAVTDMELYGVEYWKCENCDHSPLIWQNTVQDAKCESCGEWQKDILPDHLTANEIEKWYYEKGMEKGNE
jgi:hypothetical protein